MSKADAESVKWHLERAAERSAPLRDGTLTKKINEAVEHVERKLDPKQG